MNVTASGEASSASEISLLRPVITWTTPSGSPASAEQPGRPDRDARRLRGRLEHHRVAGDQGRAELAGRGDQRVVPRADGEHHADRLDPHRGRGARARVGQQLAPGLAGEGGVVVEEVGGLRHLDAGLGERLAVLPHQGDGALLGPRPDQVGGPGRAPPPGRAG